MENEKEFKELYLWCFDLACEEGKRVVEHDYAN
jgi:hypothetical protein